MCERKERKIKIVFVYVREREREREKEMGWDGMSCFRIRMFLLSVRKAICQCPNKTNKQ